MITCFGSCGVFEGGVLRQLSKGQSVSVGERAGVDSCFLGRWVCGSERFKRFRKRCEVVEEQNSGTDYRFGMGAQRTIGTYSVPVQIGQKQDRVSIDVVRGSLPLLCGQFAMDEFRLIVDGDRRQILQRTDDGLLVPVATYELGELPYVDVLSMHRNRDDSNTCNNSMPFCDAAPMAGTTVSESFMKVIVA